jgi:predicted Kef-type K+ transport protein
MNSESRTGVLLLSVLPEAHVMLLQALRNRGIPVSIARSGRLAVRKLRTHPVVVVVDLVYGPALDRMSIARVNAARGTSTVLGLHDGDLGRFADELDELVVDGFCRAGEWYPIVELASESFNLVATARRN